MLKIDYRGQEWKQGDHVGGWNSQEMVAGTREWQCGWEEAVRFSIDFEAAVSAYGDSFEKERRVKDVTQVLSLKLKK